MGKGGKLLPMKARELLLFREYELFVCHTGNERSCSRDWD